MSVSLTKGGNVSLTKEAPGLTNVVVGLGWDVRTTTGTDFDLDASAIVVGADGRVLSDKHFVFFNNLTTPDGTVEHTGDNLTGEGEGDDEQVKVNLASLAAEADKVVFPVSIYDADARSQSFGQVRNAFIRVVNAAGRSRAGALRPHRGRLHRDGHGVRRALPQRRRLEVPRRRPGLRVGLVRHCAGLRRQRLSGGHRLQQAAGGAPGRLDAGGGVSLSKVTLTKAAPSISLTKRGQAGGQLRVNLQWSTGGAPAQKKGLFGRLAARVAGAIDLDLACLWEFSDGSKGVVQALGNAFQAPYQGAPIIRLDGDDRSGSSGGENMFIDLSRVNEIRRILVFAFIYEGVPNWASADGVVTLYPATGPEIEVRLDEADTGSPTCAIATLENKGGELVVHREVRYIRGGQADLDRAYGWGMEWARGK